MGTEKTERPVDRWFYFSGSGADFKEWKLLKNMHSIY